MENEEKKAVSTIDSPEDSRKDSQTAVMLKEAGILFVITLLAGIMLGFVHELTKEPIRIQKEKAVQEACMAVLPGPGGQSMEFAEVPYQPDEALVGRLEENGVKIGTVYQASLPDGSLGGYVVESTSTQGYGGSIVLYVGVDAEGTVGGVSILEISETAGLGMEAPNVLTPQFAGKQATQFNYTKSGSRSDSEVDAISGATITTKAVTNAVNGGITVAQNLLQGGGSNE